MYLLLVFAIAISFALTVIIENYLIKLLRKIKMEQKILEIGPDWHKSKEGTPTMGGLGFILSAVIVFLTVGVYAMVSKTKLDELRLCFTFGFALLCGLIGFIDDYAKFFKKQNEGLSARNKYLLQLIAAALYVFLMAWKGGLDTVLKIPYLNVNWDLGIFYYVFALILITGIVNSVNLTDGIDGLAASVTAVVGGFFAISSFAFGKCDATIISGITIGCCVGFLVYNFYPAKVFMGDTGSLFLGGTVVGLAFLSDNPLIIVVVGIIYIIETLSVILQVASFKLTGKRIFKMSPIHHHFEKSGWSEIKIVGAFCLVTALFGLLGYWGMM